MQTKDEYIKKAKEELGEDFSSFAVSIDNEYYKMIENEVKQGKTISQAVYDSFSNGQKYHFTKHYNHRNDKIHN
ncbi:hypothetical protein MZM54_00155 [[Brevibacterium] frigoritolerans]|nr:hypothetical protein [Peribacillus frigoritolerans]